MSVQNFRADGASNKENTLLLPGNSDPAASSLGSSLLAQSNIASRSNILGPSRLANCGDPLDVSKNVSARTGKSVAFHQQASFISQRKKDRGDKNSGQTYEIDHQLEQAVAEQESVSDHSSGASPDEAERGNLLLPPHQIILQDVAAEIGDADDIDKESCK
jgi:hypothetical protein